MNLEILTTNDLASRAGVSAYSILKLVADGTIKPTAHGKNRRPLFKPRDVKIVRDAVAAPAEVQVEA